MQGKEIDMNKLLNQNEMTVAIGNARVNARGDELGPGGRIIRKREEVTRDKNVIPAQSNVRTSAPANNVTNQPIRENIANVTNKRKNQAAE
jgi:hypothetical protein